MRKAPTTIEQLAFGYSGEATAPMAGENPPLVRAWLTEHGAALAFPRPTTHAEFISTVSLAHRVAARALRPSWPHELPEVAVTKHVIVIGADSKIAPRGALYALVEAFDVEGRDAYARPLYRLEVRT